VTTTPAGTAAVAVARPARRTVTWPRVTTVVLVAAAVVVAQLWYGNRHHDYDLRIYYGAINWWADGRPLYDFSHYDRIQGPLGFTYPPFAAVVMYPMAWLPLGAVETITLIANYAALGLTTWWLTTRVADRHGWPRWFLFALAVPLATTLEPIRETFAFGQINILLAALVLGDLLVAVPGKWRVAGVGIGLAAAIKLTPAIFIVYLLLSRRWRVAITATATAAGATLLAAALAPGDSWRYWTRVVWDANQIGHLDRIPNQALWGSLLRIYAPHQPSRILWLLLVAIVAGYGLWRAAQAARAGDDLAGLTLTGLVGLLVSPVSWQHHLYWFVPAILVLVDAAATAGRRYRWGYGFLAAFVWLTVTLAVIAWFDYGLSYDLIDTVPGFLISNWYALLMLLLLAVLPIRAYNTQTTE
jgi:alpha-1,2-mannosyltransferase